MNNGNGRSERQLDIVAEMGWRRFVRDCWLNSDRACWWTQGRIEQRTRQVWPVPSGLTHGLAVALLVEIVSVLWIIILCKIWHAAR